MSEHYYRVREHGQPKVGQWVMWRKGDRDWRGPTMFREFYEWNGDVEWFPTDPPPSELAPVEDQGVEVDGTRWRVRGEWVEHLDDGEWHAAATPESFAAEAKIAAALGLVDQPNVPKTLVDWLRRGQSKTCAPGLAYTDGHRDACTELLDAIEAGEFGPVEPTAPICDYCGDRLAYFCPNDQCVVNGGESAPSVKWVTDRLPNDDEYPVLWNATDTGEATVFGGTDHWDRMDPMSPGERWVSLSVLLDAAGLGER